jgi:hypothetical protein
MTKEEKIFLLQLILEDLRGCWVCNTLERAEDAMKLAEELGFPKTVALIDIFIADIEEGEQDGRTFRCNFEKWGGYEGMDSLHNLPRTVKGKSKEFLYQCSQLEFPECRLEDWEDDVI